jgi:hypothetical protein
MSGITGIPSGFEGRQVLNQPAAKTAPVSTPQTGTPSANTPAPPADLLGRIGSAYRLDGSLPEIANGAAANIAPLSREQEIRNANMGESEIANAKRAGELECATCASRTYQDQSNDPGVSFKAPGRISPEASFAAVSSHEGEHVANEQAKARENDRKVVSQSVQVFMDTCPECGKAYASGGVTKTTTAANNSSSPEEDFLDHMLPSTGAGADAAAGTNPGNADNTKTQK